MKVIEAYKFMKKIVENGEKKGYKASNIKRGVSEYLNILEEQECLSLAGLKLLRIVANSINDIIKHNVTIDEVFVEAMCQLEDSGFTLLEEEDKVNTQHTGVNHCGGLTDHCNDTSKTYNKKCDRVIGGNC